MLSNYIVRYTKNYKYNNNSNGFTLKPFYLEDTGRNLYLLLVFR